MCRFCAVVIAEIERSTSLKLRRRPGSSAARLALRSAAGTVVGQRRPTLGPVGSVALVN